MFKSKIFLIFIFCFVFTVGFLGIKGKAFYIPDGDIWSKQALYFETGDFKQFDFNRGYGHPGGPIIEGVIILHKILELPYENPDNILTFFIAIFNGLVISAACVLSYILNKNKYWWPIVLSTLSINVLYDVATPPTTIATPLVVFLCLLTLYLYENKEKINTLQISLWAFIAGLLIATRVDIGVFCVLGFLILLKEVINWKKVLYIITVATTSFILFDPYMWYMPIAHIKDLIYKITFHYSEIIPQQMSLLEIVNISLFAILSIILSIIILRSRQKIKSYLPFKFVITLLIMTIILYTIFLTARIQTVRYFLPIISIWEVFIPLFIFPVLPKIFLSYSENKKQKIIVIFLISFQFLSLFLLYFFYFFNV